MHTFARRSLRFAPKRPARIIAGRRYCPARATRTFTASTPRPLSLFPWNGPPPARDPNEEHNDEEHNPDNGPVELTSEEQFMHSSGASIENGTPVMVGGERERHGANYGSGRKRAGRNSRSKDIPPLRIPLEFMDGNVRRHGADPPLTRATLSLTGEGVDDGTESQEVIRASSPEDGPPEDTDPLTEATSRSKQPRYHLNQAVMSEIVASISAGLAPPQAGEQGSAADSFANHRTHLKLLCPIDGGIYFLDKVVEDAANKLGADVVKIDPQTIADIGGEYIREGADATSSALWTLGYDTAEVYNRREASSSGEDEGEEFDEDGERESTLPMSPRVHSSVMAVHPSQMQGVLGKLFGGMGQPMKPGPGGKLNGKAFFPGGPGPNTSSQWNEVKFSSFLENLVGTNMHKRELAEHPQSAAPSATETPDDQLTSKAKAAAVPPRKTVVLIKDFKEMRSTQQGNRVIDKMVDIVQKQRNHGQPIMLVGTSSSAELAHSTINLVEFLQSEDAETVFRTMVVAPETNRGLYDEEERRRMREINGRHIYSMIRRLQPQPSGTEESGDARQFVRRLHELLRGTPRSTYMEDQVLSLDDVHRIVFTAIGRQGMQEQSSSPKERVSAEEITDAIDMLERSDETKIKWAQNEHQLQNPPETGASKETATFDARIKKMRKTCNQHEKNLLRGVIDPDALSTEFRDVHVEQPTIEALKMLTTLSLKRPEAFKYGVLAKDKINGCLLYGPPGTGKTLLAKAVAKESGATMLEVSGSDVYDMYVGEGEKNVRAVFSLAKKLAPCVVFIDEADAIFASRGSGTNRNSHRELINQFLREWDGMNETSAFIMVATNRPFDLDDAALRRLPRRLLVDLPSEKDREAILGIHLRDETLADDVSLSKLASQTPLYSGSDLKNLAVAAALTAVKEETEEAQRYEAARSQQELTDTANEVPPTEETGGREENLLIPYKYPEKRTLLARHFDTAMEEISASVNEDMSSLGAIRKFDEKYGDRRGRKKKTSYGFSPGGSEDVKDESVKVRS